MNKTRIAIVGAGFSGLTLAWALSKISAGETSIEIFEASSREGGMLGSKFDGILIEQAANALLASENVESLFRDIRVVPLRAGYRSKKRWIFRNGPKKFPLNAGEILNGIKNFLIAKIGQSLKPLPRETLAEWADRVLSRPFREYLVSPAFQGVYGASANRLSADLILKPLFDKNLKSKKSKLRGSVSAKGGMQEIIAGLSGYLKEKGVIIHKNSVESIGDLQNTYSAVVVATSLESAKSVLISVAPLLAEKMNLVPVLPLASVTLKFNETNRIQGFGCLFPSGEKFNSLGVLFNSDIFPGRGDFSETWIATDVKSSDDDLLKKIKQDRIRLVGLDEKIEASYIRRWEKALPLYGKELENLLAEKDFSDGLYRGVRISESRSPLYLTGNYLGVIGLAKILDYNIRLADRIKKELA